MADPSVFALCNRAQGNLERLYSERNVTRDGIARFEERVGVREGEIAVAQNTLSSIQDAIGRLGDGAVSVGGDVLTRDIPGAVRDGVLTAIRLANEAARQRQETANLQRLLSDDTWQLQSERNKLDNVLSEIRQTIGVLDANNCR